MTEAPEDAVRALYKALLGAWYQRDSHAYAELFAPGGAPVGFDGGQVPAAEVEGHLTPIFAEQHTAELRRILRD